MPAPISTMMMRFCLMTTMTTMATTMVHPLDPERGAWLVAIVPAVPAVSAAVLRLEVVLEVLVLEVLELELELVGVGVLAAILPMPISRVTRTPLWTWVRPEPVSVPLLVGAILPTVEWRGWKRRRRS